MIKNYTNYTKRKSDFGMNPSKETLQFLFDYSKSLKILKSKTNNLIELNLN